MKMTTKARYALRALLRLAVSDPQRPISLQQLSVTEEISVEYLNQLFYRLRKAGIVRAVRGPAGGFVLDRTPAEISVKDVLDAVGEEISIASAEDEDPAGPQSAASNLWEEAAGRVTSYFSQLTLQGILEGTGQPLGEK